MSGRRTRSSARSATRCRRFRCRARPDGQGWTYFGDESNAVFAASKAKEAAFRWISFLSTAENNVELNKLTGQLAHHDLGRAPTGPGIPSASSKRAPPRCRSPRRCPIIPKTPDFIARVWPTNMQRALNGEISPDDMMKAIEQHFNG